MNRSGESWNIIMILCVFLLITTGCVTQPSTKNISSTIPSIYTAPIGGFEITKATVDPNTTFETEYIFYSRNWGPGEVKYMINSSYRGDQYPGDREQLYIEPSRFTVEPNHTYKSRVYLNTSYLPKGFFEPLTRTHGGVTYPAGLNIDVSLQDNSANFGQDFILLYPIHGGPFNWDIITIENCSVIIKRGETAKFNITFKHAQDAGPREITYTSSQTPLNVTINPSGFISKHFLEFPSVVTIAADPSLVPGIYPIDFTIDGLQDTLRTDCIDTITSGQQMMPVNVTVV